MTKREYTYRGRRLNSNPTADYQPGMEPGGHLGHLVQQAIHKATRRGRKEVQPYTFPMKIAIPPLTLKYDMDAEITWGIHRLHQANNPKHSPFIEEPAVLPIQHELTIELVWVDGHPKLARAYGGDYTPPLPWMGSARTANGGRQACRKYWRNHAYINYGNDLIQSGTATQSPPRWHLEG